MPKPFSWRTGVLLAAAALSQPAFALFADDEARQGVADLRLQVQTLNERVDAMARSQLTQSNDMERLQAEVRRLTGRIEELQYKLDQLEKRQKDFYLDLDARLNALSSGGAASTPAPAAAPSAAAPAPAPAPAGNAKAEFDAALAKLQARDAKNALAAFETFLRQYPNDAQVPAAHFWAGTAALQLKQYETARRHFARVVYDTPKHELAPDAMLGLANALQGMGDEVGATDMLKRLVERYPNTPAGQVARQRLGR
ncbi:MAG: tol-pal system protein YbgF [Tepidiphilus sp.]|nr:tol-pal system protein YbgF [Tepidiphilus sp.]